MLTCSYLKFRFGIEFQIVIRWDALQRFLRFAYGLAESVIAS